ncbi:MAG: hypothetical protein LBU87_01260 [Lactobacillales bacterium]|jgi:hypothetical protein|nr:hypothetical protein [Lactobacillales bacterium]
MGSVQALENGHYFVGYGSLEEKAAAEIDSNNTASFILKLDEGYNSYRVYKY